MFTYSPWLFVVDSKLCRCAVTWGSGDITEVFENGRRVAVLLVWGAKSENVSGEEDDLDLL